MNRMVMGFFTLALVTVPSYVRGTQPPPQQYNCVLTEANAPDVRGIRLGMTIDQLLGLFPGASRRKDMSDSLGKARATTGTEIVYLAFDPAADGKGDGFAGVDSVTVGAHKGRVVEFEVSYAGPAWRNVDEWVAKLSEAFKLPGPRGWVVGPDETPTRVLKCKGVQLEAAIRGGGSSVRLRDTEHMKQMDEQTGAGGDKKRRDFKP